LWGRELLDRDIAKALREFIELMEREEYFEAHEVLELVWHRARIQRHPQTLLLKGLINGAISFEHIKRKRANSLKSSRITMGSYLRYKSMCNPLIVNFELFNEACDLIDNHPYKKIINKQV
jgi:hypothetical protein